MKKQNKNNKQDVVRMKKIVVMIIFAMILFLPNIAADDENILSVYTSVDESEEGGIFDVIVYIKDTTTPVEGVNITIAGIGEEITDLNGTASFRSPEVSSHRNFTIIAEKEGYIQDSNETTIRIIDTPGLVLTISSTKDEYGRITGSYTVTISNEDTGELIDGATVTWIGDLNGTATTVDGQVQIDVYTSGEKTISITATCEGFNDAPAVSATLYGPWRDQTGYCLILFLIMVILIALIILAIGYYVAKWYKKKK